MPKGTLKDKLAWNLGAMRSNQSLTSKMSVVLISFACFPLVTSLLFMLVEYERRSPREDLIRGEHATHSIVVSLDAVIIMVTHPRGSVT